MGANEPCAAGNKDFSAPLWHYPHLPLTPDVRIVDDRGTEPPRRTRFSAHHPKQVTMVYILYS
jgi:hypothetical protein